jgi:hypothetical protein
MVKTKYAYKILVIKPRRKSSLGRTKRRWKIKLQLVFKAEGVRVWTGCIWLMIGTSGGLL